jgi:anti-anti-sigma regulatory factor
MSGPVSDPAASNLDSSPCRLLDEQGPVIALEGAVTVAQAAPLHALALRAAGLGASVRVRCDGAAYLDASALQILLALRGALAGKGHALHVEGVTPGLATRLRAAGFGALLA